MIPLPELRAALGPRVNLVLLAAEAALPPAQYAAFRKLVLDTFGESGLLADLRRTRPAPGSGGQHPKHPARG